MQNMQSHITYIHIYKSVYKEYLHKYTEYIVYTYTVHTSLTHRVWFNMSADSSSGSWKTPLGQISAQNSNGKYSLGPNSGSTKSVIINANTVAFLFLLIFNRINHDA